MTKTITAYLSMEYGRFFPEHEYREVAEASIDAVGSIPDRCFEVTFWEQTVVEVDGETLRGNSTRVGKRYFIGGSVKTLDEIEDTPDNSILRNNLRNNGCDAAISTRFGRWTPFDSENDVIVPLEDIAAHA